MLKKILLVLVVIVIVLVVVVAMRPDHFRVERSATVNAPAAAVFAEVNDLHKFQEWSPWAKIDPNCKITYTGPEAGVGASFHWDGNKDVGEGSMSIIESKPGELVKFRLDFIKPFAATDTAELSFKATGEKTDVTWSMYGPANFMMKAMGLFMDCDKMIGKDFEKGLASLKTVSERSKP
jgi:hypothetical protein